MILSIPFFLAGGGCSWVFLESHMNPSHIKLYSHSFVSLQLCVATRVQRKGKRTCKVLQIGLHLISSEFLDFYFRRRFMLFEVEMCPERGGYVSFKSNIMHIGLRSFVITLKKFSLLAEYNILWGRGKKRKSNSAVYRPS